MISLQGCSKSTNRSLKKAGHRYVSTAPMTLVLGGAQEAESVSWKFGGLINQFVQIPVFLGKMMNPEFPPVHPVCAKLDKAVWRLLCGWVNRVCSKMRLSVRAKCCIIIIPFPIIIVLELFGL